MDKETRELLVRLYTSQLEQLAKEKGIDCGDSPDRLDYLSILGKSDLISREDVERFIVKMEAEGKSEGKDEGYLAEIEKILKDFKSRGPIFDKANELLEKMQSNFSEGNLEGTISDGVAGSGIIEDMTNSFEKVRKAFIIYAFRQLIGDVKESGIDIGEAETLVLKAADHFIKGEDKDLEVVLQEIAAKTENLQKEQAKKIKELISSVEEFIDQTKDLGADTNEAREFFRKAEEAFDSKIFKKVSYFAAKAKKATEDARKDRIQGLSDSLLFVKTILDDAKDIGADVAEAEELYSKAKTAFEEENYGECKTLIKEAEQLALQLQDAQIRKALELRRRREPEEEPITDLGKEVVEVEPEAAAKPQRRHFGAYPRPSTGRYSQTPMQLPQTPTQPRMRKTKCPNCGQSFPVMGGKGPIRIECPYCGMRGMMP